MAKKGGTKGKIPVEKITKKESLATCFTKRRYGLLSKASQLCLLSGAQIAVVATPPSSESNVSFYSFGHSSVDAVVAAFLAGHRPIPQENKDMREDVGTYMARKDLGLGFWWEDERLERSENPEELKEAIESMSHLLKNVKELDAVNNYQGDHHHQHEDLKNNDIKKSHLVQTLNLESMSATCRILDDLQKEDNKIELPANQRDHRQGFVSEENLKKNNVVLQHGTREPDQTLNLQSGSATCRISDDCLKPDNEILVSSDGLPENLNGYVMNNEEQDQIIAICENFCDDNNALPAGNLDIYSNQEMNLDQFIDFDMNFEGLLTDDLVFDNTQELGLLFGLKNIIWTEINTEVHYW